MNINKSTQTNTINIPQDFFSTSRIDNLHSIIETGSLELVKDLLKSGSDINEKVDGLTPLMLAARLGFTEIAKALLQKGASPYTEDAEGSTAIHYAAIQGKKEVLLLLESAMQALEHNTPLFSRHKLEHQNIVDLLKPLYQDKVSKDGICHGFALMGVQAILSGHIEQFSARIHHLTLLFKQHRLLTLEDSPTVYEDIIEQLQEENNLDILAFLEGLQICMNGGIDYPHLFTKTEEIVGQQHKYFPAKALSIIASKEFEEKGALLDIPAFTGMYTKRDFVPYFTSLEAVELQTPIALKLSSSDHAFTVGYDPLKKTWVLIGANHPLPREYNTIEELIDNLEIEWEEKTAFSDGRILISTTIYVLAKEEKAWLTKIEEWKAAQELANLPITHSLSWDKKMAWLFFAAQRGDAASVRTLTADRVLVNECTITEESPLLLATRNGHVETVQALLMNGADIHHTDTDHPPLLHTATYYENPELVKLLLEAGANINILTAGFTALDIALRNGHLETARVLLAAGTADIYGYTTNKDTSLLYVAAQQNCIETIQTLLRIGTEDINKTSNGMTALYTAAQIGHPSIVRVLLEAGADVNKPTTEGFTPLYIAEQEGHAEIVQILQEAGADANDGSL